MKIFFISDLHLHKELPEITTHFEQFIHHCLNNSDPPDSVFILGDLFEVWIGDDDDPEPFHQHIISLLKELTRAGISIHIMHGNRDFLIGKEFAARTGAILLDDPYVLTTSHGRLLLSHGDMFCTDDKEYLQFKALVRSPLWQQQFLAKTIDERIAMAQAIRQQSKQKGQQKQHDIMDVNSPAVIAAMKQYQLTTLIHGHTHRPAFHYFNSDEENMTRIVLPSWETQGKYLEYDDYQGLKSNFSSWSQS